jgi:hypothetical protein
MVARINKIALSFNALSHAVRTTVRPLLIALFLWEAAGCLFNMAIRRRQIDAMPPCAIAPDMLIENN